jgi:hypothetical protein
MAAVTVQHNFRPVIPITTTTGLVVSKSATNTRVTSPLSPSVVPVGGMVHEIPQTMSFGTQALATTEIMLGQPVRFTDTGLALASAAADLSASDCVGLALQTKAEGQMCLYASDGSVTRTTWLHISGSVYLTPGRPYYLGVTPGTITPTMPTSGVFLRVGYAVSHNVFDIELGDLVVLSDI